jgi:hypothetical protein
MDLHARIEWGAWRLIVSLLRDDGVDLNQRDDLAAALRFWGDCFAAMKIKEGRLQSEDDERRCRRLMNERGI